MKTKKKNRISIKILASKFKLYAAKKYKGDKLLEYKKKQEKKHNDHCLFHNSSWFGNYKRALNYKTKKNNIYEWEVKKQVKLLKINRTNEMYFKKLFSKNKKLTPSINLTKISRKINYHHPYINMTKNQQAYFEFCFSYGYINIKQQYGFVKLLIYLIENKFVKISNRAHTKSILNKLKTRAFYYNINKFSKKNKKYNRISIYNFDKYAVMNVCKLVSKDIHGLYQKETTSFWYPYLFKQPILEEYVLFNPHHHLQYNKSC